MCSHLGGRLRSAAELPHEAELAHTGVLLRLDFVSFVVVRTRRRRVRRLKSELLDILCACCLFESGAPRQGRVPTLAAVADIQEFVKNGWFISG